MGQFLKHGENERKTWSGEGYHQYSQIQYLWAKNLLEYFPLKGDEIVLDIGCGDGKITAELAVQLPQGQVIGIDQSEAMINFAKTTYPHHVHTNLDFHVQDAKRLQYEDNFDLVFSCACLQWIKDQHPVLEGICKSLKTKGRFLAVIPSPTVFDRAIHIAIRYPKWEGYFAEYQDPCASFSAEQYASYLRQAGLSPVFVNNRQDIMVFPGRSYLLQWLVEVLVFGKLPDREHRHFANDVLDVLLSQHPGSEQKNYDIHIPISLLEVQAQKERGVNRS